MALFPIPHILLKFNRGRIIYSRNASITLSLLTLAFQVINIFAENAAISSWTVGYL